MDGYGFHNKYDIKLIVNLLVSSYILLFFYFNLFLYHRYFGVLKSYICSRSQLERSIAECYIFECYIAEECLTFYSKYLNDDVDIRLIRLSRNLDSIDSTLQNLDTQFSIDRPLGACELFTLTEIIWRQGDCYILINCDVISSHFE